MQLKRPNALMDRPDIPNEDVDVPKNSASANMSAVTTPRAVSLKQASGTNDKAGSRSNLMRWVSQRSIKETFVPPTDYRYPHQG